MSRLLFAAACAAAVAAAPAPAQPVAPLAVPQLPVLSFPMMSDWLSVAQFGAKGDGVTDDTAAIQAGLTVLATTNNKTLFFPAGTFLIKTTLVLNRTLGAALLGTGRTTVLRWGGGASGGVGPSSNVSRLLWSDGNTRHYTEGFVFDGAGTCGVGLDHDASAGTQYESFNTHRNLLFTGFTVAGVRVGVHQPPHGNAIASAEQQFTNVIFQGNKAGLGLWAWNDYDNYLSGCVFADNAYGIQCIAGNYYVNNCRFQNNSVSDATIPAHSSSMRRVVSVGSAALLSQTDNNCFSAVMKVSEAYVQGWGVAGAAAAAIEYQTRGPLTLVDAVFDSPLNASSPVVFLRNTTSTAPDAGVSGSAGLWESIILVNATTRGAAGPLLDPATTANLAHLYSCYPDEGCAGDPAVAAQLPPLSASTQFFNANWRVPAGKVFDAVRDFNASNRGAETSAQLQACMNAAAAAGADAICYLQAGTYRVNATVTACGEGWTLMGGGSGFLTQIEWSGAGNASSAILASGPGAGCASTNLTIQRLTLTNAPQAGLDFALSRPATVPPFPAGQVPRPRHGVVTLPGGGAQAPRIQLVGDSFYFQSAGAALNGLEAGDIVKGPLFNGDLEIWDSDAAIVLPSFLGAGNDGITVARTAPAPPPAARAAGFVGANVLVSASSLYDVRLYNSTSLVLGSYYTETARANAYLEGDGVSPAGMYVVDQSKLNSGWVNNSVLQPSWREFFCCVALRALFFARRCFPRHAAPCHTHLASQSSIITVASFITWVTKAQPRGKSWPWGWPRLTSS